MKIPELKIGNLTAAVPIIQGGMGIGVSMSSLASAVAREGGIGVISAAQVGFMEDDFEENCLKANVRALRNEIRKAKDKATGGIIGVNIMVATRNYEDMVKTAVEAEADIIISGAGLPLDLPKLVKGSKVKIVPIVSSGKAASLICRAWDKKHGRVPDAVVVEGPEAGGHLGFHFDELINKSYSSLENIVIDVLNAVKPAEEKYGVKIPVIAAGGIYTGEDISNFLMMGASGVQMATRFVATYECDASEAFKEAYVNSSREDIVIIKSPVGMPGRAIKNKFIEDVSGRNRRVENCMGCLKKCNPNNTPYCITRALIASVRGDTENGLVFTGSNSYRIKSIVPVKKLMDELLDGISDSMDNELKK